MQMYMYSEAWTHALTITTKIGTLFEALPRNDQKELLQNAVQSGVLRARETVSSCYRRFRTCEMFAHR